MGTQVKDVELKDDAIQELLLQKHADFIHSYSEKKDDYEYIMTEYLRMSGIYWGLTSMDLMKQLDRMDRNENSPSKKAEAPSSSHTNVGVPLTTINISSNIQPTPAKSPDSDNETHPQFKRFINEAQKLKQGQSLTKCPRCAGPAIVFKQERRAKCRKISCEYNFCLRCELEFHGGKECVTETNRRIKSEQKINSYKSKKHLKRL